MGTPLLFKLHIIIMDKRLAQLPWI